MFIWSSDTLGWWFCVDAGLIFEKEKNEKHVIYFLMTL
jgi:hypothetical protein